MSITIDPNSGFCFGVTSAIRQAEQHLQQGPLCCLGDIVHNGQEVSRLNALGLETIDYDDLRTMRGGSVLLRAHGEPPSTYWIAQQNGIHIIDATCPVVKKLQERIRNCYEQHKADAPEPPQIVLFGQPGHAEVIGLQGQTSNTAIVIEHADSPLDQLNFTRPIYLFSQTTKSVEEFEQLTQRIQAIVDAQPVPPVFEHHDTICRNVANRVANLRLFAEQHDVVIFVGGHKSSNARVLFNHCREANPQSYFVSSPDEIDDQLLQLCHQHPNIGICGATSTPLWLMEACKTKLEN